MAVKGTNTMSEALQRMLADISAIKVMPDADLEWIIQLETTILQKLRAPVDSMVGQLDGGAGAPPAPPSDMGMEPGMGQAPTPGEGMGTAGMRQSPSMPNPDELRRLISSQG